MMFSSRHCGILPPISRAAAKVERSVRGAAHFPPAGSFLLSDYLYAIIRLRIVVRRRNTRGAAMTDDTTLPTTLDTGRRQVSTLDRLAEIPEEEIWRQKQKSVRTRRAYRLDSRYDGAGSYPAVRGGPSAGRSAPHARQR
jgi:hypothetical protein